MLAHLEEQDASSLRNVLGIGMQHDRYGRASGSRTPLWHAITSCRLANVHTLQQQCLADVDDAVSFDIKTLKRVTKKKAVKKVDERCVNAAIESSTSRNGSLELFWELMEDKQNRLYLTGDVLHQQMLAAVQRSDVRMFEALFVELWADHDKGGWRSGKEQELLLCAIDTLSMPLVRLMVEAHGFCVSIAAASMHESPLRRAVKLGFVECARFLIDNSAFVRERDTSGCSVLMTATRNGEVGCTELLLESGASVDDSRARPPRPAAARPCLLAAPS